MLRYISAGMCVGGEISEKAMDQVNTPRVEDVLQSWDAAPVFETFAESLKISLAVLDASSKVLKVFGTSSALKENEVLIPALESREGRCAFREISRYNQNVGTVVGICEARVEPLLNRIVDLLGSCLEDKAGSLLEMDGLSQELLNAYEEMNFFHTFAQTLAGFTERDSTCQLVLEKVMDLIPAQRGAIFLPAGSSEKLEIVAGISIQKHEAAFADSSITILKQVFGSVKSLLVENVGDFEDEVKKDMEKLGAASLLAVPLTIPTDGKPRASGVLLLLDREGGGSFGSPDLKIAEAAAGQVGVVLNIVTLLELEQEFQLAKDIQSVLLPRMLPERPGLRLAGRCIAAKNIGGDYYDVLEIGNKEVGIVVADVSGHNIASGLLMAVGRTIFRLDASRRSLPSPGDVLSSMNRKLFEDLSNSEKFISAFYLRYNPETGALVFANAGHNKPFIWRAGSRVFETLDGDGMLLGILPEQTIENKNTCLHPGDVLVVYTDGVVEAKSRTGEFFEEERFQEVIKNNAHLEPEGLVDAIYHRLDEWAEGADQSDDITVVVLVAPETLEGRGALTQPPDQTPDLSPDGEER